MDARYNEMDANMFNQYMYKSSDENLDVSLSVPQYSNNGPQQQQSVNQAYHEMNDQTFHTPSFGDEEFDIPVMHHQQPAPQHHQLDQYHQLHGQQMGIMNEQQATSAAYSQHQWHHQQSTAESHMMANQTYQLHSPNHSNYHHMSSPTQQMLLMQPPSAHQALPNQNQQQQQSHQPQMSPQLNAGGNNYIGQSPPQTVRSNENGSTSDESDDNAVNDPNNAFKRPSPDPFAAGDSPKGSSAKKAKPAARKAAKKKKDPNEPSKPVSAYALFFRDTQAAIKGQNPSASFGEVSKIVASMWDVLAPEHKNVYKKKTEAAKKDYLKALAAYRASLVSQGAEDSQSPPHLQNIQSPVVPHVALAPLQHLQQNPPAVSPHQMQAYPQMTQTYQQSFVNQSLMNQNMLQTQNTMMSMTQQHGQQNQFMNQQLHQMNQSAPPAQQQQQQNVPPQQIINNNNNQLPPVSGNATNPITSTQNCIRNGCTNAAIVSNDWEDEYCSNECVISHCRDVFGNWVHNQTGAQQQQSYPAVK